MLSEPRRPIQFDLPSTIKAGDSIPGLSARIGERGKHHGGLIIRAHGLEVQEMLIDNRLQFGIIPLRGAVLMATDVIFPPACLTPETVRLHSFLRVRDLGTVHVSGASRPKTGDGFMLKGFDKRVGSRHRFPLIVGLRLRLTRPT